MYKYLYSGVINWLVGKQSVPTALAPAGDDFFASFGAKWEGGLKSKMMIIMIMRYLLITAILILLLLLLQHDSYIY